MTTDRQPYTHRGNPGDVEIRLSWPSSNAPDWVPSVNLYVGDDISGQTLVNVDVPYALFAQMVGGRSVVVPGNKPTGHLDRIGQYRQTTSTQVTFGGGQQEADRIAADYRAKGWDVVRVHKTNYGHRVQADRWVVDPEQAALVDDLTGKLNLDFGLRDATGGA